MSPSPELPLHVLFASAGKHAMDYAIHLRRTASRETDPYRVRSYTDLAASWQEAAWSHLEAARKARAAA